MCLEEEKDGDQFQRNGVLPPVLTFSLSVCGSAEGPETKLAQVLQDAEMAPL